MKKIHLLILTTILFGQIYAQQCSKELKGTVYIDTKHKKGSECNSQHKGC